MRRLIINADDLGANPQRSHGIFQCAEFGVVTSATLIVNTSDSADAARRARERGIPTGLHLNLTQGSPLSKPDTVVSLLEASGEFLDREKLSRALAEGHVDSKHLEREIRAQVDWFFEYCGAPTHVDGHHHVHVFAPIAAALIPVLERYGISKVRLPIEEPLPPFGFEVSAEHLAWVQSINVLAAGARDLYRAHGFTSPYHFRGATLVGSASARNLRHILSRLPEGTTELMVHPGSPISAGTPFDIDPQRQTELRMLTDEAVRADLAERGIALCSYADVV